MNMQKQKGFTLIELMIVVAIIALLAAIALPRYQNYVLRSQMTRAVFELNALRTAVEVCESDGAEGGDCALDTINSDMLITAPTVSFDPSEISAEFGTRASPQLVGGTIVLTRGETTGWECAMTVPAGVPTSLIPKNCQ